MARRRARPDAALRLGLLARALIVGLATGWSFPGAATAVAAERAPNRLAENEEPLETRFWNDIKDGESVRDFQIYLEAYPDGKFAVQARARLRLLQSGRFGATPGATGAGARPAAESAIRDCDTCPRLVQIPPGAFDMGSAEMFPFEGPVHRVTISRPFYIGRAEVTVAEWNACVADKGCAQVAPEGASGPTPITNVDWRDAQQYVKWLGRKTGRAYRLPSESEWEYAARGGSATSYAWGAKIEKGRVNCAGCNDGPSPGPTPAGAYPADAFGLYDMLGNVAEWVEDCWHDTYRSAPADGSAWMAPTCQERVLRGGAFNNDARLVRSASRFKYDFDVRYLANGFRVARP